MERIPYIALAAAILLIYVPRLIARSHAIKQHGTFDNRDPRAALARLEGFGKRAVAAHNNSIEAFPMFAVGVFAALSRGVTAETVAYLSIAFVVLRSIYTWAYLMDRAMLRSLVFNLGMAVIAALLVLAIIGR